MGTLNTRKIKDYYDGNPEREWTRHDRNPFEFRITLAHIRQTLSGAQAVLDVGGGPGRYAFALAADGHAVTLLDLSPGNLAFARRKAADLGVPLRDFVEGNALDLGRFADRSFDLVLVLGPLYHLDDAADRARCVAEATRVLKPGGSAFFAFLSVYAPIYDTLKYLPGTEILSVPRLRELYDSRLLLPPEGPGGFTDAAFTDPTTVRPWLESLGCEVSTVFGAESILPQSQLSLQKLDADRLDQWLSLGQDLSTSPAGVLGSEHVVAIAKKRLP